MAKIPTRLPLIDTHCHLDLRQFDADREQVIERAMASGVSVFINPAIDLDSCRRVLALADRYPAVYAALGVHPNDCADFDDETLAALRDLAQHPKVVAIGEIGLDYYWEKVDHDQQKTALAAQLALASELKLPVILHTRNARDGDGRCIEDLLREIALARESYGRWWPEIRTSQGDNAIFGVWHAFSGTLDHAFRAYELGLVLGLGGPVTFQNARRLHDLVPQLRADRLLLETDAPYLAPHPYRGQRNEPAYLPLVAGALADLYRITAEQIAAQTMTTARRCFTLE